MREMHPDDSRRHWNQPRPRSSAASSPEHFYDDLLTPESKAKIFTKGGSRLSRFEIRQKLSADTDSLEAELQAIGAITENLERATAISKSRTFVQSSTGRRSQPSSPPTNNHAARKSPDFDVPRKNQTHKFPENQNPGRVFQEKLSKLASISRTEGDRMDPPKREIPAWQYQLQVRVEGKENFKNNPCACWFYGMYVCMNMYIYACMHVCYVRCIHGTRQIGTGCMAWIYASSHANTICT